MQRLNVFISKYYLVLIFFIALGTVWALFVPGFYGASDELHIAWLYEMDYVLKSLQIPPRYVPDLSFGFGYPLFNFVFPFPYYVGEVFHLIGFSFVDSIKLVFGISMPVSMIGMYLLVKRFTSPILALSASVLYGYGPYRAVDIYIRGAIGEIVALALIPFLVWSVIFITDVNIKIVRRIQMVFIGSLLLIIFILSHNITAYMFLPWLGILSAMMLIFKLKEWKSNLLLVFLFFLIGVLGSSYFWVPALVESNLVKYDTVFNFVDHFPTLKQLFTPYWGYGASVPGPYDGMSFFLGFGSILTLILGITFSFFYWRKTSGEEKLILIWVFWVLMWCIFMMNFRSSFVWQLIPFIAQFQFPWRFLIMVSFVLPLFLIIVNKNRFGSQIGLFLIMITIFCNFSYFRPQDFLARQDQYFFDKYLVYPEVSDLYLTQSEEYLRLPVKSLGRPEKVYPNFFGYEGNLISLVENNRLDSEAKINFNNEGIVSYNKYNFPGWSVFVDGKEIETLSGLPFGQISFKVPAGEHHIRVLYKETIFRSIFNFISFLTILIVLIGIIWTTVILKKGLKYKHG